MSSIGIVVAIIFFICFLFAIYIILKRDSDQHYYKESQYDYLHCPLYLRQHQSFCTNATSDFSGIGIIFPNTGRTETNPCHLEMENTDVITDNTGEKEPE